MKIEEIKITEENIFKLMTSKDTYVIKKSVFGDKLGMYPIGDCEISILLSDEALIVKITD